MHKMAMFSMIPVTVCHHSNERFLMNQVRNVTPIMLIVSYGSNLHANQGDASNKIIDDSDWRLHTPRISLGCGVSQRSKKSGR